MPDIDLFGAMIAFGVAGTLIGGTLVAGFIFAPAITIPIVSVVGGGFVLWRVGKSFQ